MRVDVLVLGGGLTGLVAAVQLCERGAGRVVVLEGGERPGGLLKTNRDGVSIDHLPHVFFSCDERATRLFKEWVGPVVTQRHRLGVLWRGGVVDYPFQNHVHQLPLNDRRAVLVGLLADRGQRWRYPKDLETLAVQRLGSGLVDLFFRPYNEKLWQTPLHAMSPDWLASRIRLPSASDLADSILGVEPEVRTDWAPHAEFIYPAKGGIESTIDALLSRLPPGTVQCNERVVSIDTRVRKVKTAKGQYRYDALISTLPLCHVLQLAGIGGGQAAARLRWNRVVSIHLLLDRVALPERHWLYVPDPLAPYYRLTRSELIAPDSAGGAHGLVVECALGPNDGTPAEAVAGKATRDLIARGVIEPGWIRRQWTFDYEPAYPVQTLTWERDVPRLLERLMAEGIRSAGRFGEWAYYNMDHAILAGLRAADEVAL